MKLYLDEHVSPLLAHVLRERGIDCVTTQEAGNIGKRDHDQLTYAADQGRVLLLRLILHLIARHGKQDLPDQILWLQNYKDPPLP
jgi:predicted nuclease of predicted toxin-antitoxin system